MPHRSQQQLTRNKRIVHYTTSLPEIFSSSEGQEDQLAKAAVDFVYGNQKVDTQGLFNELGLPIVKRVGEKEVKYDVPPTATVVLLNSTMHESSEGYVQTLNVGLERDPKDPKKGRNRSTPPSQYPASYTGIGSEIHSPNITAFAIYKIAYPNQGNPTLKIFALQHNSISDKSSEEVMEELTQMREETQGSRRRNELARRIKALHEGNGYIYRHTERFLILAALGLKLADQLGVDGVSLNKQWQTEGIQRIYDTTEEFLQSGKRKIKTQEK